MDENYIDIVRKSLYGSENSNVKSIEKMPRKEKKIKFSVDRYNSETVFKEKEKLNKIKNRKCTPFKKKETEKRKMVTVQSSESSFEEETTTVSQKIRDRKPTPKKKTPKKRKLVLSFSSDSFEEDTKDSLLSPSKSEMEFFQNTFIKSNMKKTNMFEESNESEGSVSPFNLDTFFNTYEPSLNESITEAHSGIDNEFESEYISDVNIIGGSQYTKNSIEELVNELLQERTEEVVVISDSDTNGIPEDITEQNITEVATKIQETVVLGEEDEEKTPRSSPVIVSESMQQQEECVAAFQTAEYYDLKDGGKLIILKQNQSIPIYGLLKLKVLHGKIEVFGRVLDKTSKEISLYSARGSALLQITNVPSTEESSEYINHILSTLNLNNVTVNKDSALIMCTKLKDFCMVFVEKYISQQIFPKINGHKMPQAIFEPKGSWNIINQNDIWNNILIDIKPTTKLMLAGGKGVGKSTLLRFLINRLLNVFDKIRVIDLDPGQSEFAVPGCISIVDVTEPVLGPNYTHLRATDRSLLSNINVGQNPRAYIKCVQSLMAYCDTLEDCPTLINYMGFVQGIGLKIISSTITYIRPTDIVQIQSRHNNRNFTVDLSIEVVQENCNLFTSNPAPVEYNLRKIPAMNDNNDGWSLEPRQSREMCVLAYLGQMMQRDIKSLTSHNLAMYEIRLSSIKITNSDGVKISPAIVNANLVALCTLEEESKIFVCLGYGVVRGIDLESNILVLLTPEAPSVLEKFSHLVLGSVSLPPSIYMTPDDVKGNIPYVMQGELVSLGQITKRTYLPVSKK